MIMQAIIFIGIQATGKSTFFKEKFFDTHLRINLDMLKTRHRERTLLKACFESGHDFVVDNTNPSAEERKRYIVPAKAAHFEVVGYYFESKITDALQRNRKRSERQRIPDKGILSAYHKLQIPSLTEGFDKLYYVMMDSRGSFTVEEWSDEIR
jgi:predicted kinase